MASRGERVEQLVGRIDPHVDIDPEATQLLSNLVGSFLQKSLEWGVQSAGTLRSSHEVRICDMRPFVQDELELDVVGFAVEDLIDEMGVGSRAVLAALKKRTSTKAHLDKLESVKEALRVDEITRQTSSLFKKKKKRVTIEKDA